ncbi:MAG: Gfo/Idh/MocA family oxidoreductase [Oscillospiraceae bacterium]|nr:Gfo/Idh/MocA family oxidoreductase [Oscillospiraceae bacterium]
MSIKVGIIGCGKIAQVRHIPEYAANPHTEVYGFYDINLARAEELAEKYNGKAYASYEELLADPAIEAVSVCAANHVHAEITVAALKAGKHVLCEKPMAVTLEECEAMVAAARESGKYLMIGQNQRLAKAHAKAKELIEQGAIGKVLTFRTIFGHGGSETWSIDPGSNVWFFDKTKAAMGAMADLGIHKTDMIQYVLGSKIVKTQAVLSTLDKKDATGNLIGVDDNAICIYQMENGIIGTMTASWTYYAAEDNTTVIYGTKGELRLYDDPKYSVQQINADGTRIDYQIDQIQTNDNQTASGIIDLFVDCLVEKKEPEISGENVLHAMKAVFASIESSAKGCVIEVK